VVRYSFVLGNALEFSYTAAFPKSQLFGKFDSMSDLAVITN
jgi:hypothetical protein